MRIFIQPRFWLLIIAPQLLFAVIAFCIPPRSLIPIFNVVTSALAAGICVAFSPAVLAILKTRRPVDRADVLALGVWGTWFARALGGIWSWTWRFMGQPLGMINSDAVAWLIYLTILSAILHLAAPGAITDTIPPARWVKIGILVTFGVLAFFILGYSANFFIPTTT